MFFQTGNTGKGFPRAPVLWDYRGRQVPFLTGRKYWISVYFHRSLYSVNTDEILIQQIEMLSCGENCHRAANLIGAYRSAAREDQKSDCGEYRKIFCEAERQLRVMLAKLRLSQAGFAVQWD